MDLKVQSPLYYDRMGSVPRYNFPVEIGYFSINSDGKYVEDNHQMKYIAMPDKITDLHMDLNEGYSKYIDIVEDTENGSSTILKWILSHEKEVKKHFVDSSPNPEMDLIVCGRSILTNIASTIYETDGDWCIQATKFRSVIYLQSLQTEKRAQLDIDLGKKGHLFMTYGFKFEQFMTSDNMDSKPDTSVPVNENEKQYIVVKGKLDNTRLLFNAEVDGVDTEYLKNPAHNPNSMLRFVELKTSMLLTCSRKKRNFLRYKLIKWYLQCYFAATPRVICGFRNEEGIVKNLGIFNVKDMPKMAEGFWSRFACMNFCSEFLNYVKKCVVKDDPKVVYEFYWRSGSNITCEELNGEEDRFLPEWYTEKVKVI